MTTKGKSGSMRIAASMILISGLALAGCANQTVRDLEGVPVKGPAKAELYMNIDKYPNIARLCIDGVAFATTTKEYEPVMRVPEWDGPFCRAARR